MQGTRSQSKSKVPKTRVLDFSYDDEKRCTLIVRINDARFYIVADSATLRSKDDERVFEQYCQYLGAINATCPGKEVDQTASKHSSRNSLSWDSGIDMTTDTSWSDTKNELQNWLLSCFAEESAELAPAPSDEDTLTMEEWYNTPVYFYQVEANGPHLQPQALEESAELRQHIDDLFPSLSLPKSLSGLDIPLVSPSDLAVLSTADVPSPIHPAIVRWCEDDKRYFFKPLDPTQPQSTQREIKYLHKLQSRNLHEDFNVPEIHGLVAVPGSKTKIMGLLLTLIEGATPLTTLLDSEVDESKRKRWARESERIIEILHKNNIVWGDAKADNFVVDANDALWIIDFGGGYTEGWVDAEKMETLDGDNEAMQKIVDALKDPDQTEVDMEEDRKEREQEDKRHKRKRSSHTTVSGGREAEPDKKRADTGGPGSRR